MATEYESLPYIPSQKMTVSPTSQKGVASVWSGMQAASAGYSKDKSATLPRKPKVDLFSSGKLLS